MFILRWFLSRTVRQAVELRQQVRKILNSQRDLLTSQAIQTIDTAIQDLNLEMASRPNKPQLRGLMNQLEKTANQLLKPYSYPAVRENVEMLLVVGAVVLAFRTFFFQPMAIPSGSAQPTLYGITEENLRSKPIYQMAQGLDRLFDFCVRGIKYYHVKALSDGAFHGAEEPKSVLPFVKKQRFQIGGETYTVWFPPERLFEKAGLHEGQLFQKGDDVIKLKISSGDHLFVNRMTYNFRQPKRGEIIVFESTGIPGLIQNTHYIKRLVALGDEHVRIGNDRHLIINGIRLDASTPHFENVYGFDPKQPPQVDHYSGHVNEHVARENSRPGLASLFPDETQEFVVRPNHYLTMGDNTMNSHDSRNWGDFPREKVIGKCGFVFWPITQRFGWGNR